MDFKLIELIIVTLINTLSLVLAFVVYYSKKNRVNTVFSIMTLVLVLWIDTGYLSINYLLQLSTVLTRINIGLVPFFIIISYYFVLFFTNTRDNDKLSIKKAFLSFGLLLSGASIFSNTIIRGVNFNAWGTELIPGIFLNVYYFWVAISLLLVLGLLFKQYFSSDKLEKKSLNYFILGILMFVTFNIVFNIILPIFKGTTQYYKFGDYSVIFYIGFTAYAIAKFQLFNIKVIATEITVVILSLALLIEVFISNDFTEGLIKLLIWVLATYGGYILIKSVKVEIKQKEELQVLATKLDEANKHLEELDEAKDNFLSMASHELNTPIAAIEGYLSMIIDEKMAGPVDGKMKEYLSTIYSSSKRLAALVRDLLNVSRIESNRIHIIYEQAQIEDVIKQAVAEVAIKAKEVGHTLTFEKPTAPLPKTYLDVSRIVEVMINLIGNAIKYTEPGGKITVKAHADNKKIVVSVEDNGRGIPEDKMNHVFEKFAQVDVLKDQVKGTGLGMFITKNLVELHKGQVWFKSRVGETDHGTIFYFSLPILNEKPEDPHEGEGALFQTRQPQTPEQIANKTITDKAISEKLPQVGKVESREYRK